MPGIDDLMSALPSNKELSDKLTAASSPDVAVKIAADAGYTITNAELLEAYKTKMATMSEEELANVAGGKGDSKGGNQQNQSTGSGNQDQNGGTGQANLNA